jgi:hypothetical protein
LGEPLRAQKKQQHFKKCCCFFCGSRRAIRSITFAAVAPEVRLGGSVVPLLSLSRKRQFILLSNWGKLGGCFRKAQLLFLKSSVARILKIKQARNNIN